MYLFQLFRSLLPLHNPIGFGASDFLELSIAAFLVAMVLAREWLEAAARRIAQKPVWAMLLLAILPAALRLALVPRYPVPTPSGADEFSQLLVADTDSHLRLANPPHPMSRFFEGIFTLQEPTYSSIFPLGQGITLALGRLLAGNPWGGVLLSVSVLCALCYWMLWAWTTPAWALAGGLMAISVFGPLSSWTNSYWGGAVSGIAGCLVFGSIPRLVAAGRMRYAILLGLGGALQLLARPLEAALLTLAIIPFLAPALRNRRVLKGIAVAVLVALPAVGLSLLQNKRIAGSWSVLPYMLSRYEYGVPASFTFQPNPVPHRELTAEQQLDYEAQAAKHGDGPETFGSYFGRYAGRARFYRFFFLAPLYAALPFFLASLGERRRLQVAAALLVFTLGVNFYPYFYPHYIAAAACLLLLAAVMALRRLSESPWGREAARLILFLCAAHFLFWYGLRALAPEPVVSAMASYETWDFINSGDPEGRIAINSQLTQSPGKQLVFVRYGPRHMFHTWIRNAADIDGARVVWAGDLGAAENEKLVRYYPERTAWLVEPDAHPPRVTPFQPAQPETPAISTFRPLPRSRNHRVRNRRAHRRNCRSRRCPKRKALSRFGARGSGFRDKAHQLTVRQLSWILERQPSILTPTRVEPAGEQSEILLPLPRR